MTATLDHCLETLARDHPEVALVAVGGYGRGELCLYSDIDLLVLHDGPAPDNTVRSILYPLWDAGMRVGHATRTVRATLGLARDDLSVLCNLLSARRIAGPPGLPDALEGGLSRLIGPVRLSERLAAEERAIWDQEPFPVQDLDLKVGRGGLRSLHRLDWDRGRAAMLGEEPELSPQPGEHEARQSLLAARQALHAVQKRAADRYAIELRGQVGKWLQRDPVELATEVYRAARLVDSLAGMRWARVRPAGTDPIAHAGLAVVRYVRSRWGRSTSAATPLALARAASASGSHGRLSPWEHEFCARSGPSDWTEGDRAGLVALLAGGPAGWEALAGLWRAGWLTRALPEIAHVYGLAQVAPFHRHPVDAHLGATVAEVVTLADGAGWYGELAESLGGLDEVLLAAFLHDIGKGLGQDHSSVGAALTRSLLDRLGFGHGTIELVAAAVRHHLLLPVTAGRRDIEDPAVVAEVASVVGNQDLLRVLALLSVADARATGPDMWTAWKELLLRGLFEKVSQLLEGTTSQLPAELVDSVAQRLPDLPLGKLTDHLGGMPPGYLVRFGPELVAQHLRLAEPPLGEGQIKMAVLAGAPVSTLVIAARDRPGLLATVAGVLSLHNLNVLEARVATRSDGLALDTFRVEDALGSDMIGQGRWPGVRQTLEEAMAGRIDLEARLGEKRAAYRSGHPALPPSVKVMLNTADVRASDRVGLLHDLAAAMAGLGLEVDLAKIDTRGGEAVDLFEFRNPRGQSEPSIRSALLSAAGT
ncbi:MAG: ACT domain-containing protein [Actinomycetota bacterium]